MKMKCFVSGKGGGMAKRKRMLYFINILFALKWLSNDVFK